MGCGCKGKKQEQPVVPTPATIQLPESLTQINTEQVLEETPSQTEVPPTENQ
jgi:hypothetical protein